MIIRVLFADDQIPTGDSRDAKTRAEIIKELSGKLADPGRAFDEDHKWFQALLEHLGKTQGFKIVAAKTFAQAQKLIQLTDTFDVAVVDLSWTGDPDLKSNQKKNIGLELLEELAKQNKGSNKYVPVIAFSQNFKDQFELVRTVLEADALPIQKDYTDVGHRILAAAIRLLTKLRAASDRGRHHAKSL